MVETIDWRRAVRSASPIHWIGGPDDSYRVMLMAGQVGLDRYNITVTWYRIFAADEYGAETCECHRDAGPAKYVFDAPYAVFDKISKFKSPLEIDMYWPVPRHVSWCIFGYKILSRYLCSGISNYVIDEQEIARWISANQDIEGGRRIAKCLGFHEMAARLAILDGTL